MIDFDDNNDWSSNWAAFDRFICNWLRIDFTRDSRSPKIDELERAAGVILPPSARQWCALAFALQNQETFCWRDCLVIQAVPGHDAISLLQQGP